MWLPLIYQQRPLYRRKITVSHGWGHIWLPKMNKLSPAHATELVSLVEAKRKLSWCHKQGAADRHQKEVSAHLGLPGKAMCRLLYGAGNITLTTRKRNPLSHSNGVQKCCKYKRWKLFQTSHGNGILLASVGCRISWRREQASCRGSLSWSNFVKWNRSILIKKKEVYAAVSKEGLEERTTLHKGKLVTRQEVSQIHTAQLPWTSRWVIGVLEFSIIW